MRSERHIVLSRYPWIARCFSGVAIGIGAYGVVTEISSLGQPPAALTANPSWSSTVCDAGGDCVVILVGLGFALVRYRVVLDGERRMTIKTVGWGPWSKRTDTSLTEARCIDLGHPEQRGSGSDRHTAIPVRAVGLASAYELVAARSIGKARSLARRIASALNLPVGRSVSGSILPRASGRIDQRVADVSFLDKKDLIPPRDTAVTVIEARGSITIRYPMSRPGAVCLGALLVLTVSTCVGLWWVLGWLANWSAHAHQASTHSWSLTLIPVLAGLVGALVGTILLGRTGLLGGRIRIDPEGRVHVAGRTILRERLRTIDVVHVSRYGCELTFESEFDSISTARGNRPADLIWIRALVITSSERVPLGD